MITLKKPSTVTELTYIPRNLYSGGVIASGAIEQCKVYVKTKDNENWQPAGEIGDSNAWTYVAQNADGSDQNFKEKTVSFTKTLQALRR